MNDETRAAIEASLRKKKMEIAGSSMRAELRKGVEIKIGEQNLHPDEDAVRSDSDVLATVSGQSITWGTYTIRATPQIHHSSTKHVTEPSKSKNPTGRFK